MYTTLTWLQLMDICVAFALEALQVCLLLMNFAQGAVDMQSKCKHWVGGVGNGARLMAGVAALLQPHLPFLFIVTLGNGSFH